MVHAVAYYVASSGVVCLRVVFRSVVLVRVDFQTGWMTGELVGIVARRSST